MVCGSPISNRFQIYSLNFFHTPNQALVVQPQSRGFWKTKFRKILFGQIIFISKFYIVLYTWHDYWAEVLDQGEGVRVGGFI